MKNLFVGLGAILIVAGCGDLPEDPPPQDPPMTVSDLADRLDSEAPGTEVSLLFVVSVSAGMIMEVSETEHTLTFDTSALTAAIAFTDRPERHAFDVTMPMLAAMWSEGENSFSADPPNAVIEDSRSRVAVTVLTGLTVEGDSAVFRMDRLAYRTIDGAETLDGEVQDLRLFIDSGIGSLITTAGVAGLLRAAAQGCVAVDCYLWPLGA